MKTLVAAAPRDMRELAPLAAGEVEHPAVARGVRYLLATRNAHGLWDEEWYTAVGFSRIFPLWALARYHNLRQGGDEAVGYDM